MTLFEVRHFVSNFSNNIIKQPFIVCFASAAVNTVKEESNKIPHLVCFVSESIRNVKISFVCYIYSVMSLVSSHSL